MKRFLLYLLILSIGTSYIRAQEAVMMPSRSLYDTDLMLAHLNAVREMNERAIQIRNTVQPYIEQQYHYYIEVDSYYH